MLVEPEPWFIVFLCLGVVIYGPRAAALMDQAAMLLLASPEAANTAAVSVEAPLIGDEAVVLADGRDQIIAALAAAIRKVLIARQLESNTNVMTMPSGYITAAAQRRGYTLA